MYSIRGTIKTIMDEQVISDKFKKREFVITTTYDQYPQDVLLELTQDKTELIDKFAEGESVTAHFNLRGREWTSPKDGSVRYFNTIQAWRIESDADSKPAPVTASASDDDDLPF